MNCKKCGQEVDKKAVICPGCGCKIKKPFYKKWWFWTIIVVVVIVAVSSGGNDDATSAIDGETPVVETESAVTGVVLTDKADEIVYEEVDLQTMFDDLEANAMKAENNYMKKYIEFECKIASFDSDGSYISVEPVNASEWNFKTAMCYIKNDTQKTFLIEKNVGDRIKVKGKVKSIGEILGYSIDISEVY